MTNAQRRHDQRNRHPHPPQLTAEARQLELGLRQLDATRRAVLADEERTARLARPVPTSGSQRRQAKVRARRREMIWSEFALHHYWVRVDPNQRVQNNWTTIDLDELSPLNVGDEVVAYEPEDRVGWCAELVRIDEERQLGYLAVAWTDGYDCPPSLYDGTGVALSRDLQRAFFAVIDDATRVVEGLPAFVDGVGRVGTAIDDLRTHLEKSPA